MKKNSVFDRVSGNPMHLAVAMLWLTLLFLLPGCGGGKKPATTNGVVGPTIQHVSQAIAGGAFIVEPGQYKSFKLAIAPGMAKPSLEGSFEASGGNNDVEVLLLESTQFLNWQNGHRAASVYSSGRVTSDRLEVSLPEEAATYYLIFSNKFSYFRNKAVKADMKLLYDGSSTSSSR